ncbi:transposase, partial [Vibrio gazogenes DSM 21264]
KIGVAAASRKLNLYEPQLYNWRSSAEKKSNTMPRVARLKRQLTEKVEDLAILKKAAVDSREHRNTLFNHV